MPSKHPNATQVIRAAHNSSTMESPSMPSAAQPTRVHIFPAHASSNEAPDGRRVTSIALAAARRCQGELPCAQSDDVRTEPPHAQPSRRQVFKSKPRAPVTPLTARNTPFTWTQILIFFLTYTTYALVYFARKPLSILKPQIQSDNRVQGGVSAHTLALLDSCFLIAYTAGQFIIPALTSGVSLHATYITSFFATASSLIAFSSARDSYTLVLMWTLNGLAQSSLCSFSIALLTPYFPSSVRGRLSGLWTTCQNVGSIVSSWLAAVLVSHGWRWVLTYISMGMMCWSGVLTLVLVPLVKRRQRVLREATPAASPAHSRSNSQPSSPSASPASPVPALNNDVSFRDALQCPGVFQLGVLYFCVKAVRYNLLFWLPYLLTTQLGMSTSAAGTASIVFDVGGIIGVAGVGFLSDALPRHRVTLTLATCTLSGVLVLVFAAVYLRDPTDGLTTAGRILLAAMGISIGAVDSIAAGPAVQDTVDRASAPQLASAPHFSRQAKLHALALSCVNGLGSMGSVLQGVLTTFVVDRYGWYPMLSLLGMLCIVGSTVAISTASAELRLSRAASKKME